MKLLDACAVVFFLNSLLSLSAQANPLPISTIIENDLGHVQIVSQKNTTIEVNVPSDAFSIFVQVEGQKGLHYFIENAENPKGEIVLGKARSDVEISDEQRLKFPTIDLRLSPNPSVGPIVSEGFALMIPNNESVKLLPGRWKFSLKVKEETFAPHMVNVRTLIKKLNSPINDNVFGTLDVNLYFSGSSNWTSTTYKENPNFKIYFEALQEYLATAGILASIKYVEDVPIPSQIRFSMLPKPPEDIIKNAKFKSQEGISVFFTTLTSTSVMAISWGIPGILPRGEARSGVLASLPRNELLDSQDQNSRTAILKSRAAVLAHEIGHYLGLLHVCEIEQTYIDDGLSDTQCAMHSNLMMPDANPSAFSLQQRMILFRNPSIQLHRK